MRIGLLLIVAVPKEASHHIEIDFIWVRKQ